MDSRAQMVEAVARIVDCKALELVLVVVQPNHRCAAVACDGALRASNSTTNILPNGVKRMDQIKRWENIREWVKSGKRNKIAAFARA